MSNMSKNWKETTQDHSFSQQSEYHLPVGPALLTRWKKVGLIEESGHLMSSCFSSVLQLAFCLHVKKTQRFRLLKQNSLYEEGRNYVVRFDDFHTDMGSLLLGHLIFQEKLDLWIFMQTSYLKRFNSTYDKRHLQARLNLLTRYFCTTYWQCMLKIIYKYLIRIK